MFTSVKTVDFNPECKVLIYCLKWHLLSADKISIKTAKRKKNAVIISWKITPTVEGAMQRFCCG